MLDCVIRNGQVVTEQGVVDCDVAIKDGVIVALGDAGALAEAEQTLADAKAEASQLTESAQSSADAARAEYETLKAAAENYRATFRKLVEDQLEVLKANDILFK